MIQGPSEGGVAGRVGGSEFHGSFPIFGGFFVFREGQVGGGAREKELAGYVALFGTDPEGSGILIDSFLKFFFTHVNVSHSMQFDGIGSIFRNLFLWLHVLLGLGRQRRQSPTFFGNIVPLSLLRHNFRFRLTAAVHKAAAEHLFLLCGRRGRFCFFCCGVLLGPMPGSFIFPFLLGQLFPFLGGPLGRLSFVLCLLPFPAALSLLLLLLHELCLLHFFLFAALFFLSELRLVMELLLCLQL
mmetsp:Transcript_35715/g.83046  ORF Transcript_35715/g.83046 Transcript_35715/m.83046 type:complete len:242 (+) Transcript_35715:4541-5266(+)